MSSNVLAEVAKILNQMFITETFEPESIMNNVFTPFDLDDATGIVQWIALSNNGTMVNCIGMTMTEFIQHHRSGRSFTKTHDMARGWQLHVA